MVGIPGAERTLRAVGSRRAVGARRRVRRSTPLTLSNCARSSHDEVSRQSNSHDNELLNVFDRFIGIVDYLDETQIFPTNHAFLQ